MYATHFAHRLSFVRVLVVCFGSFSLQWRHNGCNGVSNHQPHICLLNRLFRRRSKKISKLRVTGHCEGNTPVTGEFPAQRVSNAENVSIWLRHHFPYIPTPVIIMTSSNGNISALLDICAGNHRSKVNSPHNGQWREAFIFSLICAWVNRWVNNREAGDLRSHPAHYDVIVMFRFQSSDNTYIVNRTKRDEDLV